MSLFEAFMEVTESQSFWKRPKAQWEERMERYREELRAECAHEYPRGDDSLYCVNCWQMRVLKAYSKPDVATQDVLTVNFREAAEKIADDPAAHGLPFGGLRGELRHRFISGYANGLRDALVDAEADCQQRYLKEWR